MGKVIDVSFEEVSKEETKDVKNIVGAKLITRELVVGEKVENGIKKPLLIIPQVNEQNQNHVILHFMVYLPVFFEVMNEPEIKDEHVMNYFKLPQDIIQQYSESIRQLSAEIQTVKDDKPLIIN